MHIKCLCYSIFKTWGRCFISWDPVDEYWLVIEERNEHYLHGTGSVPNIKYDNTRYSIFSTIHSCQSDNQ